MLHFCGPPKHAHMLLVQWWPLNILQQSLLFWVSCWIKYKMKFISDLLQRHLLKLVCMWILPVAIFPFNSALKLIQSVQKLIFDLFYKMTVFISMREQGGPWETPAPVEKIQRRLNFLQNARYCTVKAGIVPVQDTKSTQPVSFVKS